MRVQIKTFLVTVGDYNDRTQYIVRGAKDAEDAKAQVTEWYKKNYSGDCWDCDYAQAEELIIKKGVTRL